MNLSVPVDLSNFDPSIATRSEANHIGPISYEGLLGYKTGPDLAYLDIQLAPQLAERWEVSPDARQYTFYLRKGVKFAERPPVNGREVNAGDVKWSYEYWTRTGPFKDKKIAPGTYDWMLEGLESIEARDASTMVVRFKNGFVPFLNYSASFRIPIAPHEIYDADGHLQDQIAGTGPFQLDMAASQRGSHWIWKKNPSYWQQGRPYLDEVRTIRIADEAPEQAAFQAKQIDSVITPDSRVVEELKRNLPDMVATEYAPPFALHLWMNLRPGNLLTDKRLRQAVSLGIDRDEFIRTYGGRGEWALAGVFPGLFNETEVKQMLRFDPTEARRLVAEAGYPNGIDMAYMLTPDTGKLFVSQSELLQAQLKKAGINLVMKSFTNQEAATKRRNGDGYDIAPTRRSSVDTDVDSNIYAPFHSQSPGNFGRVNDPKVDALVDGQRREPDAAKRREIVREAARYIAQESLGMILPYSVEYRLTQPYLRGYQPNFGSPWPLTDAWLAR
jgi:peptide/nickel transport system substrate-binding protein